MIVYNLINKLYTINPSIKLMVSNALIGNQLSSDSINALMLSSTKMDCPRINRFSLHNKFKIYSECLKLRGKS